MDLNDVDGGIQLNLTTTTTEYQSVKRKKIKLKNDIDENHEQKEPKKRKSFLIKGNKSQKKLNETGEELSSKHSSISAPGVISSLFNKNPERPRVKKHSVTPVKEDVFADESFEHLSLHPFMISNLEASFGIQTMTVIQKAAIPPILSGDDVLVKSQTGSGKTLAFLIPIIQNLQEIRPKIQRSEGIKALIVVPTRELAIQCYECLAKLLKPFTWIVPGYLIGGEKKKSEKNRIRKGINVLISTPGRLIDHLQSTKNLSLEKVGWLVIDEADRLLDMGYEKDLAKILEELKKHQNESRRTIMVSATLTPGVEELAGLTLNNPTVIDVSVAEEEETPLGHLVIPEGLQQEYAVIPMKLRLVTLISFLLWKCKFSDEKKILIFMSAQDMVDFHTQLFIQILRKALRQDDFMFFNDPDGDNDDDDNNEEEEMDEDENAFGIFKLHGNMSQKERTHVFLKFKEASAGVLICTDVAARGLDLPQVHWIVQYSVPLTPSDYVHRVGRTARIGTRGSALLFLLPSEIGYVSALANENISLEETRVENILETLTMAFMPNKTKGKKRKGSFAMEEAATSLQLKVENAVLKDKELREMARKAFLSHTRAYASYPATMRQVLNFKSLHLGHLAKSLGLRESPSSLGSKSHSFRSPSKTIEKKRFARPKIEVSEFGSGFDYVPPKPKKMKRGF